MTNQQQAIRVLIADDQPLVRDGLAALLSLQAGLAIVGSATNGSEAVAQARTTRPDVILMDVRMPVLDGIGATERVRVEQPSCRVLMLTTFDDEEYIVSALKVGATGYILKDTPIPQLAEAIRQAHGGMFQLTPTAGARLAALLQRRIPLAPLIPTAYSQLSEREREVFALVVRGQSNQEIAQQLCISEGTVKNHLSRILATLHLRDRTHIIIFAYEHGLAT